MMCFATSVARPNAAEPRPVAFTFISTVFFAVAVVVALTNCQPADAQGLVTFTQQSTPRPHSSTSFASLATFGAIFSGTSTSPMYHPENSADGFAFHTATIYPEQNLGALLPVQQTKTSFITELRVPLAELYGSRVHLGFFMLTMQNGNMTLGPLATLQALHSPSLPRSVNLYGVGLSIPLGKQSSRLEIPKNLWTAAQRLIRDR